MSTPTLNDLPRLTDEEREAAADEYSVMPAAMDAEQVARREEAQAEVEPHSAISLRELGRDLDLKLSDGGYLYASLFLVRRNEIQLTVEMLAMSSAPLDRCHIDIDSRPLLFIDDTTFNVTQTEAEQIVVAFPDLRVERQS